MVTDRKNIPVKERLKEYIASVGISEREFCRRVGVSSGYIESIKQSISPKVMQSIGMQFPELNPLWLLLGKGAMTKDEDDNAHQQGGMLPSEMLAELLAEARNEKARLLATNEKLTGIIESQQQTIEALTRDLKKDNARQDDNAECAVVG